MVGMRALCLLHGFRARRVAIPARQCHRNSTSGCEKFKSFLRRARLPNIPLMIYRGRRTETKDNNLFAIQAVFRSPQRARG
jgi:hypothetical protein